ncbi:N-acyl-D-amino-acid deacylase family protein [Cupriavidus necator]
MRTFSATSEVVEADLVLTDALLVDGTGAPPVRGNLAIKDGRIAALGDFPIAPGTPVRQAAGRVVAPGFIDSHTHDDGYLLVHPEMKPRVSQGVTTVVTGNCGISLAPLVSPALPQPLDLLGSNMLFRFTSFTAWLQALRDAPAAVNVVPLVGHTTLRVAAMTETGRAATNSERDRMRAMVGEAMDAGAFGLSTGTFYPPAAAAPTDEIIDVSQPLLGRCAIYATHLRDEADHIVPAMHEALAIGRALDARVVFSHHKVAGERNHGRTRETLALIDQAAAMQPVCLDCHPYPATSTMLRLDRVRLASRTLVTWSEGFPDATGRDFADVMAELGLDDDATVARLSPAGAIYFLMDEGDIRRIYTHPLAMVGSDGLPFDRHPHPRQWGTFPRMLRALVREQKLLTLPAAIHKMTGLPARQYGLRERGLLRDGFHADLVMFDPETITDLATFSHPVQASCGIEGVWVNGEQVWDGAQTGKARPGRVLAPAREQ